MGSFPYHSHIFRDSYGSGMGIVWEAYHKGVPLLRVPGITLDNEGKDYTWYISGIYCRLGDYMLPTTFYKIFEYPLSGKSWTEKCRLVGDIC